MFRRIALIVAAVFCTVAAVRAQQEEKLWAVGLSGGASFGINESQNQGLGPHLRLNAIWLHGISSSLSPEIGLGFVANSGDNPPIGFSNYRNSMLPVDLRLRFSPFASSSWSPYIYAGIGAVHWSLGTEPPNKAADAKASGIAAFIPLGGGLYHRLSKKLGMEISAGWNASFTDNLNDAHDGRNDAWWHAALTVVYHFVRTNDDFDEDGLKNDEERTYGTDPRNPDTDGDGLSDGDEVYRYHTNPLNFDSDGDGLRDGDEVNTYHTNPLKVDTDSDGINDNEEINRYHTDPLNPDTDGDGLKDGEETGRYHTDPLKSDTDGDGLSDGEEILKYHTDPLKADTDRDGLSDGEEVNTYHTDPHKADTDGGSVGDGVEVHRGTNPLDPTDDVPKK